MQWCGENRLVEITKGRGLVGDVIDRVPNIGARAAYVKQLLRDKLIDQRAYINKHGDDMPEIRDWKWRRGAIDRATTTATSDS